MSIENDISLYNYDQLTSVLNNTMKLYNATEGMKTIDGSVFYGNTQIRFWIKIKFRNAATDDEMITYEVHFGSIDYVVTFEEKYISPEDEEIFDAIVRSIHVDN